MRAAQAAIAAALLVVAAIGCAVPLDFGDPFPKERPADADLPGVYTPTDETRAMIAKGGYPARDTSIELRADGSCHVQNLPDWWRDPAGESGGGFDSGSGRWQLVTNGSYWSLELDFSDAKAPAPQPGDVFRSGVFLMGQSPPYRLMLTVGDPDCGKWMQFSKAQP